MTGNRVELDLNKNFKSISFKVISVRAI